MSAIVSGYGAVYLTQTATRTAAFTGVIVSEVGGALVNLVGNLSASPSFGAALSSIEVLAGGFVPTINFSGSLATGAVNYVDFSGNIGSVSLYGKRLYGKGLYSRGGPFAPAFAADLSIVGIDYYTGNIAPVVTFHGAFVLNEVLAGNLAPTVTFSANLSVSPGVALAGNLAPQVTFAANLTGIVSFSGDLAPQVRLAGDVTLTVALDSLYGSYGVTVVFADSSMISGPLWGGTAPCAPPAWGSSEPCPASLWTPTAPCGPVDWEDTELCNG